MLAVVVAIMLAWAPLEVVDAGFWLTCLATLAIMLLARRLADRAGAVCGTSPGAWRSHHWRTRVLESAVGLSRRRSPLKLVLLPVTAYAFSQVSIAGLALNFLAIPLMTVVQVAGIAIVFCTARMAPIADIAGIVVGIAARGIVSSSNIVDAAPWSAPRVAPPPLWLLLACQLSLCLAFFGRPPPWRRRVAACAWFVCLGLVVWALPLPSFTLHAIGSEECQMADSEPGL